MRWRQWLPLRLLCRRMIPSPSTTTMWLSPHVDDRQWQGAAMRLRLLYSCGHRFPTVALQVPLLQRQHRVRRQLLIVMAIMHTPPTQSVRQCGTLHAKLRLHLAGAVQPRTTPLKRCLPLQL